MRIKFDRLFIDLKNGRRVKLKNTCNFIAYSKIKKNSDKKMIGIKCEGKTNGRGYSKILHGWCKFKGGDREKGKEMVFGAKPVVFHPHAPHHRLKDVEIFQTLLKKNVFGSRTTLHVLPEWCGGHPHVGTCVAHVWRFF